MNKYLGEVPIKLGEKTYKIVYDWRAISEFQSKFGNNADVNTFSIDQIAETLVIGLSKHHPDITLDDIMAASPPIGYVSDCIVEAFVYAQHGVEEGKKMIDEAKNIVKESKKKPKKTT